MLEIIREAQTVETPEKSRDFQLIGEPLGNGYSFPVDENDNIILTEASRENYEYCLAHPEKLEDRGVVTVIHRHREPKVGRCRCGEEFPVVNEYLGACECPGCGQWYNLFGQELNDPSTWKEGDDW